MHVIGTAGHVDHGKSTLIEVLTGVHPDRLKEEQQREMTIDLGFGWLPLDNGQEVGIVDVPGHIDFIGNLLSGIGGIDAVLFVIAADEGIMPQTREHESIVRLLQIQNGIIVITKSDLVKDTELISLLKDDITELFRGSALENAPRLMVSARTGDGITELNKEITNLITSLPPKPDYGRPRLPVDRVFQLQGIGTVVTGTLQDGTFSTGESVHLQPSDTKGRIRELQIHGKKVNTAGPGNRVAINISGVSKAELQRGDVVVLPDQYKLTNRIDVFFQVLANSSKALTHNSHVQLFIGAKSVDARVRVLGKQQIAPGETGFLQLEIGEYMIVVRNDRFILRHFSPGETIGGGYVINAHPAGRYKRFQEGVLNQLSALSENDPSQLVSSYLLNRGYCDVSALCRDLNQALSLTTEIVTDLAKTNQVFVINKESTDIAKWMIIHSTYKKQKMDELLHFLEHFHSNFPMLNGASLLQIRSHLKVDEMLLSMMLQETVSHGDVIQQGAAHIFARKGHTIRLTVQQKAALEQATGLLRARGNKPPTMKELAGQIGQKMIMDFIQAGLLVKVADDLVYLPDQIEGYTQWLQTHFTDHEKLELALFRDEFMTSRKYAQALLEYFDRIHLTERIGDYRVLYKNK